MPVLPDYCWARGLDHPPVCFPSFFFSLSFPPPAAAGDCPAARWSETRRKLIIFHVGFIFNWVSSLCPVSKYLCWQEEIGEERAAAGGEEGWGNRGTEVAATHRRLAPS